MTMPGGGRSLADAYVSLHVDASKVPSDVRRQTEGPIGDAGEKAGSNFGSRMAKSIGLAVAAGAAIIGTAVVKTITSSIKSASDLNETLSKTDAVFGKQGKTVKAWAKNVAIDFGQTQQSALDAASTFAIYGKTAKLSGKDLFNFSTHLTGLASDMASFSNTSPEEAIQAIGSALRGENDPIEKYGVLLNEASLKQIALKKGIIDTTKGALTPQQRVLAVQAALYEQLGKKGSNTIGDFERTMGGLANQQRIAKANTENLRAEIGGAFLPVVTNLYKTFNAKVIPTLQALWQKHGPAITKFIQDATTAFGEWFAKLDDVDWSGIASQVGTFFANLKDKAGPALQTIKDNAGPLGDSLHDKVIPAFKDLKDNAGTSLTDSINVFGVVIKFAADHVDTLAKALPYLAVAYGVFKVAQLAANVAMAAAPFIRIAEIGAMKAQTKALQEQTVALAANRTAVIGGTVATGAQTGAESVGMLTRLRNTAATIASTVASKAARAATLVWTGVQWALNAAMSANPIGLVVAAIVALIAIVVVAYKKNETFRNIVNAVWSGIKVAIKATVDWFVNTAWPWIKKGIDALVAGFRLYLSVAKAVWSGVWTAISAAWGFIRDKVFNPMRDFITKTIPDAFRTGTGAIGTAWDKLKELAAKPVRFVIDTVVNKGIVGTFNKVSGFFGGPKIPSVPGIGDGYGDGAGGKPKKGTGDGLGDMLGFLKGPANWIKSRVNLDALGKFGNNPFVDILGSMGRKMLDGVIDKAKSLISGSEYSGGGAGTNGLQPGILGVLAALRGAFGDVPIISGFRPGAFTLTGNRSYHASGRAIDIRPFLPWAAFINATFGGQLRELITPWQNLNILNGRPHTYTGAVWNQHNFAGGNAHIHAAMDDGGRRFLMPGLNVIPNGTGAREPIYGPAEIQEVVAVLLRILEVLSRLAPEIGRELGGATAAALTIARAR